MVDEKAKKVDTRARNWSLVVYPESAPENWRDILDDYHIPWVESPLHDKDVNPDGEIKKEHWHIGLFFSGKKSYGQILEITSKLNCPNPQVMKNAKGQIRYFAHLDNPEKYQYKPSEIIAHGGADIRKYLTATGGDKIKLLAEMQDWIDETGCTEFYELARYARNGSVAKFPQKSIKDLILYFDYACIPIRTLISVDTENPKSVPFLRFFLYIPLILSMPLIVVEAVRRL